MAKKNQVDDKKEPAWWRKEGTWLQKEGDLMTKGVKVDQVFSLRNDTDNVNCQKMGPKLERLFILACRSMLR